jgi:repressor LexA
MLSTRPKQILEFIERFLGQYGYPPSVRQIQRGANISSTSVVKYNLEKLKRLGYIEHDERVSRGIRLVGREPDEGAPRVQVVGAPTAGERTPEAPVGARLLGAVEDMLRVPLLGRIAAGEPIPIPSSNFNPMEGEAIMLTRDIVKEQDDLYALQVRGDSMIDALVHDGDVIVMKHVTEAHNGEMVAVWLKDREETTLKRFYLEKGRVRLQPANPTMKPIFADPHNVEIQGRVVAVIRKLQ